MRCFNTIISYEIPCRMWFRAGTRVAGSVEKGWAWAMRWDYRQQWHKNFVALSGLVSGCPGQVCATTRHLSGLLPPCVACFSSAHCLKACAPGEAGTASRMSR